MKTFSTAMKVAMFLLFLDCWLVAGVNATAEEVAAFIQINSATTEANIEINGRFVCRTPCGLQAVKPGTYQVRASRWLFYDYNETVEARIGQTVDVNVSLVANAAGLIVSGSEGRVFVDNIPVGNIPFEGEVSAGQHTIKIEAPGFAGRRIFTRDFVAGLVFRTGMRAENTETDRLVGSASGESDTSVVAPAHATTTPPPVVRSATLTTTPLPVALNCDRKDRLLTHDESQACRVLTECLGTAAGTTVQQCTDQLAAMPALAPLFAQPTTNPGVTTRKYEEVVKNFPDGEWLVTDEVRRQITEVDSRFKSLCQGDDVICSIEFIGMADGHEIRKINQVTNEAAAQANLARRRAEVVADAFREEGVYDIGATGGSWKQDKIGGDYRKVDINLTVHRFTAPQTPQPLAFINAPTTQASAPAEVPTLQWKLFASGGGVLLTTMNDKYRMGGTVGLGLRLEYKKLFIAEFEAKGFRMNRAELTAGFSAYGRLGFTFGSGVANCDLMAEFDHSISSYNAFGGWTEKRSVVGLVFGWNPVQQFGLRVAVDGGPAWQAWTPDDEVWGALTTRFEFVFRFLPWR